jgi:hypothetical protein
MFRIEPKKMFHGPQRSCSFFFARIAGEAFPSYHVVDLVIFSLLDLLLAPEALA